MDSNILICEYSSSDGLWFLSKQITRGFLTMKISLFFTVITSIASSTKASALWPQISKTPINKLMWQGLVVFIAVLLGICTSSTSPVFLYICRLVLMRDFLQLGYMRKQWSSVQSVMACRLISWLRWSSGSEMGSSFSSIRIITDPISFRMSDSKKEEVENYLKTVANPILEELVTDLVLKQPKHKQFVTFCIHWLHSYQNKEKNQLSDTESEDEDAIIEMEKKRVKKFETKKGRTAVSAEVYGDYNRKEDFKPRVIDKNNDVKTRILTRLKQSFIFRNLDDKETHVVIDAMEEKKFKRDETVIQQGDDGDCLYVVDQGELDCYKSNGKDSKYIKTYVPGEVFGELALLYNAPRAATITAKTDAVLFALDRLTFNTIVKDAAEKRRRNNEEVLKRVEILKEVEPYERGQIADVLREIKVRTNEIIISEGEVGDKFYIVSEGAFVALKKDKNHNDQVVFNYKEGDYFGELALLKDIPRQASVQALTNGKLLYIERDAFKRILGPMQNILQRNAESYKKFAKK